MNVGKRILFEIIFFLLLCVLMPFHFIQAMILLTIECFKVYPQEIYNLAGRIVYGEGEDS